MCVVRARRLGTTAFPSCVRTRRGAQIWVWEVSNSTRLHGGQAGHTSRIRATQDVESVCGVWSRPVHLAWWLLCGSWAAPARTRQGCCLLPGGGDELIPGSHGHSCPRGLDVSTDVSADVSTDVSVSCHRGWLPVSPAAWPWWWEWIGPRGSARQCTDGGVGVSLRGPRPGTGSVRGRVSH